MAANAGRHVQTMLGLRAAPIAVAFLDTPPRGLEPWNGGEVPAGCTFWRKAMQGAAFYTVPSDHYHCAVGAYTHGINLPPERASELGATLQLMGEAGYVTMDEVPGIPRRTRRPEVVAYAPVDEAPFPPDVVVVAATPAQGMRIYEAALKSGAGEAVARALGRPACAVLPLAMDTGAAAVSLGCIGNRTFTGLPDAEMYVAIPGTRWPELVAALDAVQDANAAMERHYVQHAERLGASE